MSYTTTERSFRRTPRRSRVWIADAGMLVVFLVIVSSVAALGTVTTIDQVDGWYADAPHVTWTPPNWAFGIVWTVLYAMIAVAGWLVWLQRDRHAVRVPFLLYITGLVANSLWTPVFFGGYPLIGSPALWMALALILVLDLLVAGTITAFWGVSKPAALLLMPYFVWILYASTLNWGDAALIGFD